MTTMPMPLSPFQSVLTAVRDLLGFSGYGTVEYAVNDAGDLVHARTVATVEPRTAAERTDLGLFLARLRREHGLRADDTIELRYHDGKLRTAIITRKAP
jgi:hypothetical protein